MSLIEKQIIKQKNYYLLRLRALFQFADFLLIIAADLLLLGCRDNVDKLLAKVLFNRNANFIVDNPIKEMYK